MLIKIKKMFSAALKQKKFIFVGVFLLFFTVIFIIYFPAIQSTFILDDYVWIKPLSLDQIKRLFVGSWEHGNTLRPIMRLQFLSDRILFGENPFWWHITTIIFHALVSWVVYIIIRLVTGERKLAFLAGLVFAVFPANHEVVAWISGRTHSFGLLLSLGAGYLLYRAFTSRAPRSQILNLISGFIFLLLAYLTYELSFALPLALLAAVIILGPRTRQAWVITAGSGLVLMVILIYRYYVLGGSLGSVGAQQTNIFLAPLANLPQIIKLFWYSKELKIVIGLMVVLLGYNLIKGNALKEKNKMLYISFLFFILSVVSYLPFSITKGVAPRFLYTSLFFFVLALTVLYAYLKPVLNGRTQFLLACFSVLILFFSVGRTWEVANRYAEVGRAYDKIIKTVTIDFPEWPAGRDMLFYNIPNSNWNVLAFLTYFPEAIKRHYPDQGTGLIYRAERLSPEELDRVLDEEPVVYEFVGFDAGVRRIEVN